MAFRKFGVPEDPAVRVLTPPDYQTVHRREDTVSKLEGHVPGPGGCGCGNGPGGGREWAEHVADLLLGRARPLPGAEHATVGSTPGLPRSHGEVRLE